MKKKYYAIFIALFVLGVSLGIYYLKVVRPGTANIPNDIVMQTAFNDEYSFDFENQPKKARLIEFMYTNCPDVCPVTSLEMSKLRTQLIKDGVFGDKIEFVTVTIDPEHDTPEVLKEYAERFEVTSPDDGWVFLSGTDADTKKLAESLRFLYRDPGNGEIIHSTFTYFLDADNNLIEQYPMGVGFDREKVYTRIANTLK